MTEIFDAHLHYGSEPLWSNLDREAGQAHEAGVRWAVNAPVDFASSVRALEINDRHPWILPSLGTHPLFLGEGPLGLERFDELAAGGDFVAVGEVGLDFWEGREGEERQREALQGFALIAKKYGLPLVLHARKSFYELLSELKRVGYDGGGIIHGFSGSADMARAALDAGLSISVGATLSNPKKSALREVVAGLPKERVLVETDAPDLPPWPRTGDDHRPCELAQVVESLASVWSLSVARTARITMDNALALFGVSGDCD